MANGLLLQVKLLPFADYSILILRDSDNLQLRKFYLLRAFNQMYMNLKKIGLQLYTKKVYKERKQNICVPTKIAIKEGEICVKT